jgi:hypothetical protein
MKHNEGGVSRATLAENKSMSRPVKVAGGEAQAHGLLRAAALQRAQRAVQRLLHLDRTKNE